MALAAAVARSSARRALAGAEPAAALYSLLLVRARSAGPPGAWRQCGGAQLRTFATAADAPRPSAEAALGAAAKGGRSLLGSTAGVRSTQDCPHTRFSAHPVG